jgi:hypothetical protein
VSPHRVYENVGIGVRIRSERVYGMARNPQAERGDRGDGAHAAQDGVAKLEERVTPASEGTVEVLAERPQRLAAVSGRGR